MTSCTHVLVPSHAFQSYYSPLRLSSADFPLVSFHSPLLFSCFLGSLAKASFASVWRLFNRHGYLCVQSLTPNNKVPLCRSLLTHLAKWQPLRCPKLAFILLSTSLPTYHNEHFLFLAPPRSFGLFARGFAGFFIHGPGVCHVCWVPPCPSDEGGVFSNVSLAFSVQQTPEAAPL